MRAGDMDRRIVIETVTESQDDYGGRTETWSVFATVWAKKSPFRGQEDPGGDRINATSDNVWKMRWIANVTHTMRINEGGVYHDIQRVAEIGRREGLEITTRVHRAA